MMHEENEGYEREPRVFGLDVATLREASSAYDIAPFRGREANVQIAY